MHLTELNYPIAIQGPNSVMGGKHAGLSSPRRWRGNDSGYYLRGEFQGSIIYSSDGGRFEVEKIFLKPLTLIDKLVSTVAHAGPLSDECNVEMELQQTGELSLTEFCETVRGLALQNPSWWKRHSDTAEIEAMFVGCNTIKDAINDIGVLDASQKIRPRGKPTNVIDQR
ncbi:hypothetical protein [Yoonia sp. 1_MG-2023]|uniref:hypothetical protein n=1 Tax=Yoonia sp. 1_MG-2023 TaxID=3062659 RepID=UPI0011BF3FC9|nr:hypothetical protein [Yoonia sp. 1_MG-2023]